MYEENTIDGDEIVQTEWEEIDGKSFLKLTYTELKEKDGQGSESFSPKKESSGTRADGPEVKRGSFGA